MTDAEFAAALPRIVTDGVADRAKVAALDDITRVRMAFYLASRGAPILKELVPAGRVRARLAAAGYVRETTGAESGLAFIHKTEHAIR